MTSVVLLPNTASILEAVCLLKAVPKARESDPLLLEAYLLADAVEDSPEASSNTDSRNAERFYCP